MRLYGHSSSHKGTHFTVQLVGTPAPSNTESLVHFEGVLSVCLNTDSPVGLSGNSPAR